MRGFIIGLLLAGTLVIAQDKVVERKPIAISPQEITTIKDSYTNLVIAQKDFDNTILRIKVTHTIPIDYIFDFQSGEFKAPAPVNMTTGNKTDKSDKP